MKKWMAFWVLVLAGGAWAQPHEDGFHYTFRPGDTLWTLCERFAQDANLCWKDLAARNNIANARSIAPGTRLIIPLEWLREQPVEAQVQHLVGAAYRFARGSEERQPLNEGDRLRIGDAVETEEGSLHVIFADRSRLVIRPHSRVVFDRYSRFSNTGMVDTNIRLERGSLRTFVTPRQQDSSPFIISTPTAAAAVRGTEFDVSVDEGGVMRAEVDAGLVAVSAQSREQEVADGYGTLARPGQPPMDPVPQLPAVLPQVQSTSGSILLAWEPLQAASAYDLELYQGDALQGNYRVTESRWQSTALAVGDYRVQIRALDEHGLKGRIASQEVSVVEPPVSVDTEQASGVGMKEVLAFVLVGLLVLIAI